IVRLLFEHGKFTASDTASTSDALLMYAVGLYCYSAVKVAAPAFYALDRTRVPLIGSAAAVAVNLALNLTLFSTLSFRGLALGTALGACVNFAILLFAFGALVEGLDVRALLAHLAKVALAAAGCGAAALAVVNALEDRLGVASTAARVA